MIARAPAGAGEDAIVVENLVQDFPIGGGKIYRAIDGVSFRVRRGTTHASSANPVRARRRRLATSSASASRRSGRILVEGDGYRDAARP